MNSVGLWENYNKPAQQNQDSQINTEEKIQEDGDTK